MIVLAVGMPRAGSGWHYNLTHDLLRTTGAADARAVRSRYHLESVLTQVNCNIRTLSLPRLARVLLPAGLRETFAIKVHAGPTLSARLLIRFGLLRPTYIYRDPRDALLSAYEYGQRARATGRTNAFSPLQSIEDAIAFMAPYVADWARWTSLPGVHHLRYEDLKGNYDHEANRLATFLGVDLTSPEAAAVIDRYRPEKASTSDAGLHFQKGVSGRFRELLTPDQQQMALKVFGSALSRMGYAPA